MFTGLVDDVGTIDSVADTPAGREFRIRSRYDDLADGESVAVNGACLTVRERHSGAFTVAAVVTTLGRTTIDAWRPGMRVNLERALRASDRLGGHIVQGHVDGVGIVQRVQRFEDAVLVDVEVPAELAELLVPHGSITVDGVSLTVNALPSSGVVQVSLIEYTLRHTTLGSLTTGDRVHVEGDVIGKYVRRLVEPWVREAHPTERPDSRFPIPDSRFPMKFGTVPQAIADVRAGKLIVVADDEDRENEGDLICAAQLVTPALINFMLKAKGMICLALTGERVDQLGLPPQGDENTDAFRTAFTVSIDAAPRFGVTTGISAADRAKTIQVAVDPATVRGDLRRPGHVHPLRARDGGVLQRVGHTEAAVDLARLAGLYPAGVICEILNEDGSTMKRDDLARFAEGHGLTFITVAQLVAHRLGTERLVHRVAEARLPTEIAGKDWRIVGYRNDVDTREHVALVFGDVGDGEEVLVRMHSKCLTGDVFHSMRCDCGWQLHTAMQMIAREGRGVVVYLDQEGRGIGLLNKLKAYELQDSGHDTVEANEALGFKPDLRNYGIGAQILLDLGLKSIRVLTNNPKKLVGLEGYGLRVADRVRIEAPTTEENAGYLATKVSKLGHLRAL